MQYERITSSAVVNMTDPATDNRLLPPEYRTSDNSRRMRHLHRALHQAMEHCLTPVQREQLELYYWRGMKKKDIARIQEKGPSAVTKSMRAGEAAIRAYIDLYMEIYDALERELLSEE